MASQWDNFRRNLGEWRGSFTSLDREARELESTASILNLEQGDDERLVHFRLRRFADGNLHGEPSRDNREDYRSLGRQVVFFDNGSFCKGTLQVAPGTVFGGEFGFIHGDRRHRLVQLHREDGVFDQLVLIREWRTGHSEPECPPLQLEQLHGRWSGQAQRITADWPEPETLECRLDVSLEPSGSCHWHSQMGNRIEQTVLEGHGAVQTARPVGPPSEACQRFTLLSDGGYHLTPEQVSHRQGFSAEAGWLSGPGRLERLIRRFDASGAWRESIQLLLHL